MKLANFVGFGFFLFLLSYIGIVFLGNNFNVVFSIVILFSLSFFTLLLILKDKNIFIQNKLAFLIQMVIICLWLAFIFVLIRHHFNSSDAFERNNIKLTNQIDNLKKANDIFKTKISVSNESLQEYELTIDTLVKDIEEKNTSLNQLK